MANYKAAVIGSSGKGGYGHHLDTAFLDLGGVDLLAVADSDPDGRAASVRFVNEMEEGVYRSHLSGGIRVTIPLEDRSHPLE